MFSQYNVNIMFSQYGNLQLRKANIALQNNLNSKSRSCPFLGRATRLPYLDSVVSNPGTIAKGPLNFLSWLFFLIRTLMYMYLHKQGTAIFILSCKRKQMQNINIERQDQFETVHIKVLIM